MSYYAIVKAETKFCNRYPVEHNEFVFVEVQEYLLKPDGPCFDAANYFKLYQRIAENYGKKPSLVIVRPVAKKWWQFWRWF